MVNRNTIAVNRNNIFVLAASLAVLGWVSTVNFLLFHMLVELFSVVVCACAFIIIWYSRERLESGFVLFLGIGFFFVSVLSLLHALAYEGMDIFGQEGANLSTQLWIASRYLICLTLMSSFGFVHRKLNAESAFVLMALLTALLLGLIVLGIFPDCYRSYSGLTRFKTVSEYAILAILLVVAGILFRFRQRLDFQVSWYLIFSLLINAAAEFVYTFCVDLNGIGTILGHFLSFIAAALLFLAVVEVGILRPQSLLFRELEKSHRELEKALEESVTAARVDYLTGLNNRWFWMKEAERELMRSRRYAIPLSMIMIDLDNFKRVNDTLGHSVGDEALIQLAKFLLEEVRNPDIPARLGGDEFVILLPETSLEEARSLANRLQNKLESLVIQTSAGEITLRASMGVSITRDYDAGVDGLIQQADQDLYRNKLSRNPGSPQML